VRRGRWNTTSRLQSRRIKGKVLGLVGFGVIGKAVYRKVAGLGLERVLINDPFIDDAVIRKAGGEPVGLEELLRRSDFVSIHAPLNDETRGLIGEAALAMMKKEAILVNTARGPLVDTEALVAAVRAHRIACAGLDVHDTEPLPADSPLMGLEDVILSDHVGWYTEESIVELKTLTAQNVAAALRGERPRFALNEVAGR
jgi:D-3-phosphoglycerate dehydrogenase